MAKFFIPAQLKDLTSGIDCVEFDAATVRDALAELDGRFPGIKQRLCENDELSPALQVSINGEMSSQGMYAKIPPDGEVHFLPAIGGG